MTRDLAKAPRPTASAAVGVVVIGAVGLGFWLWRRLLVVTISGESMTPTYRDGDRVLVRRTVLDAVCPGQVVVIEAPDLDIGWTGSGPSRLTGRIWIIKRAVAVPGDPLPRQAIPAVASRPELNVPDGCLLVLGDNPRGSHDSRAFGYVPAGQLLGVVVRKLTPPRHDPRQWDRMGR